ncbi:MAG: acyl-CoA dehydratase activase-related protein [Actinomycetota bacterium]
MRTVEAEVGMVSAFTGKYRSARVVETFLREAGYRVRRTPRTTPDVLEAGTTLSASDYCLPLRAYVGHFHRLLATEPKPRFIVAPNVCSEDEMTSTCSKYRDPGGVALRSLGSPVAYTLARAGWKEREKALALLGPEEGRRLLTEGRSWPELLQPNIWSLRPEKMEVLGYRLLCRLRGVRPWRRRLAPFLPPVLGEALAPWNEAHRAMRAALEKEARPREEALRGLLGDPNRPRLGLVGRVYLVEDPLLTSDVKAFFKRAGCAVLTATDVPFEMLERAYLDTLGYYDTHRLYTAFIEYAASLPVDGFVLVSSFGCHPDAFESEWLADYARGKGLPAWYFRFDEQSGRSGFNTRFETILGFLEERRDVRLGRRPQVRTAGPGRPHPVNLFPSGSEPYPAPPALNAPDARSTVGPLLAGADPFRDEPAPALGAAPAARPHLEVRAPEREPVITWPSFNPLVDLALEEIFHQAGLGRYLVPPLPPTLETIALGEGKYSESCCPYGITTGSFVQTLTALFDRIEAEARTRVEPPRPRRVFLLQGRGEGPCTYGWYSLAQAGVLPEVLADRLARGGHTLEMATLGLKDARRVLSDLAHLGDREKLKPLLELAEAGALDEVRSHRDGVGLKVLRSLGRLAKPARVKLEAAEAVRARALIVRAHEIKRGATSQAEKRGYELLRRAHTLPEIEDARRQGLRLLDELPQDPSPRPRVVSVGEIYVALSPFANRGAVDVLLGREGIEVVEGVTLSGFMHSSMREMRRRTIIRRPGVRAVLGWLWRHGVPLLEEPFNRGPEARPFLWFDVGGEGVKSASAARTEVEAGVDGVLHLYPFKCMPEGIAKDALAEMCRTYGVRYLPMSFGKETDIERIKTEIGTFAELLRVEMTVRWQASDPALHARLRARETRRRRALGRALDTCVRSAARLGV